MQHNQGELTAVTVKQIFFPKPRVLWKMQLPGDCLHSSLTRLTNAELEINSSLARSDGQVRQGQPTVGLVQLPATDANCAPSVPAAGNRVLTPP